MMANILIDRLTGTSVILNGIAIPGNSLDRILSRHSFNIFIANDDQIYSILLNGTGTAILYNGHYFLICTQHQLGNSDRQNVGMITRGSTMVTSGGMRHFPVSADSDANDLVAFNFNDPLKVYDELKSRFFNLPRHKNLDKEIFAVLLIGCPSVDQNYDVYENNHIGLGKRSVVCMVDPNLPSDNATIRVVPYQPLTVDPDGMSGGAAFFVCLSDSGFEVDFGGIIVRGGPNSFTVIKAAVVESFLDVVSKG